jgi:hypothetical protein
MAFSKRNQRSSPGAALNWFARRNENQHPREAFAADGNDSDVLLQSIFNDNTRCGTD